MTRSALLQGTRRLKPFLKSHPLVSLLQETDRVWAVVEKVLFAKKLSESISVAAIKRAGWIL